MHHVGVWFGIPLQLLRRVTAGRMHGGEPGIVSSCMTPSTPVGPCMLRMAAIAVPAAGLLTMSALYTDACRRGPQRRRLGQVTGSAEGRRAAAGLAWMPTCWCMVQRACGWLKEAQACWAEG